MAEFGAGFASSLFGVAADKNTGLLFSVGLLVVALVINLSGTKWLARVARIGLLAELVGAGGIGFELIAALRTLQYDEVAAILLVILATVTVVDALGGALRKRFQ